MIKFFLISLTFFVLTSGAIIRQNCTILSLTEEELKSLKDVAEFLKTLKRNLDEGQESFKKEMKDMYSDIKQLILDQKPSNYADLNFESERLLFGQAKNDDKNESTMKTGKSRGDNEIDIIGNFSIGKTNIYIPTDSTLRPADCSELLVAGHTESGIFKIYPFKCRCTMPVKVFCDMDTDGGGWTVFLSRMNTSKPENFTRNWEDYKNGFGSAEKEYWIGNEVLHIMTTSKNYILRMEAEDKVGSKIWGEWNSFSVNSEDDKYRLLVTTYNTKSTAYDRFKYHHNNQFSTFDSDNDKSSKYCTDVGKGGWWYNDCFYINPTGIHGKETSEGIKIDPWSTSDSNSRFADWLQLKIRPKICSSQISTSQLNKHNCALN